MMKGKAVDQNSPGYANGKLVLEQIQAFNEFKGVVTSSQIERVGRNIATGQKKPYKAPPSPPLKTKMLHLNDYMNKDDVFVYCDFSRFGDTDISCAGKPVDKKGGNNKYRCNKVIDALMVQSKLLEHCETQTTETFETDVSFELSLSCNAKAR